MKGVTLLVVVAVMLSGCSHLPVWMGGTRLPSLKVGNTIVTPPAQVGKAATIDQRDAHSSVAIPAGTTVTVTHIDAQAATPTKPGSPATSLTVWQFDKPSEFLTFDTTTKASSGTVDNSVAIHGQDIESKRPLLYAALAALVATVVSLYLKFPTPALLCGIAAGVFFAAWKLADMPGWVWGVGVAAIGVAVGIHLGFFRGERFPVAQTTTTTIKAVPPTVNSPQS